ncbi:unnamed protein product [Coffea canephora]|uniref:DH200=94 genomic scaffold, scaffold_6954 n=1 Tax=Coffea canephora TaxID=49390 RepID=A0A068VMI2_COFCA|nr:unnamed protein product [Coffea canephora]
MTTSSSSSVSTSSGLVLNKINSSKLDYFYEVFVEPEVVNPASLPLINPYTTFGKKSFSPTRVIKSLIQYHPKGIKEYIQASKIDQHPIPATKKEQFITLHIPNDFPLQWRQQGYTHVHFGAIRISLPFHGRKGLPIVARVALLDTRFTQYQHACIATVETTLNAGTVFVTLFPNFNMSLVDPHLLDSLKVHVQIIGVDQVQDAIAATLHYQMAYRVQNHALDLTIPGGEDALLIQVDEKNSTSCTHIPRQISKSDLVQLLPNSWITDYENLHTQANEPLESSNSRITKTIEGRTSISFDHSHLKSSSKRIPSIMLAEVPMQLPTQEGKLWGHYEENCEKGFLQDIIEHFDKNGEAVYHFQDPTSGHIYFDTCTNCEECYSAEQLELDASDLSFDKKKNKPVDPQPFEPRPCKPDHKPQVPNSDNFQSARSKFDGYQIPSAWVYQVPKAKQQTKKIQKEWKPVPQPLPKTLENSTLPIQSFMFQETDFPPLESFVKNGSKHTPKIQNAAPIILPTGESATTDISYEILNWQMENSLVQNSALTSIHHNVSEVSQKVNHINTSVDHLDTSVKSQKEEVSKMIRVLEQRLASIKYDSPANSSSLANFVLNQEKETKFLQRQIATLKETGDVPKYDIGPFEPPPQVSLGFGAIPLRNWPTPFYFGNVTTPNPSVFFPDQPQPVTTPLLPRANPRVSAGRLPSSRHDSKLKAIKLDKSKEHYIQYVQSQKLDLHLQKSRVKPL